jgi:hypothetical protein
MTETMQETAATTRYTTGFNHKLAPRDKLSAARYRT